MAIIRICDVIKTGDPHRQSQVLVHAFRSRYCMHKKVQLRDGVIICKVIGVGETEFICKLLPRLISKLSLLFTI